MHLYGLDFGGGGLAALASLPHCGGVIAPNDREGQHQLVRRLKADIDRRRMLDAEARAAEPFVVVLVDALPAFLAEHDGIESAELLDDFNRVVNEGPGVGVLLAVTAERPSAIAFRMLGSMNQRLLLRLTDPTDYSSVGVRLREAPKFRPGRAYDQDGKLVQIAAPGNPETWPGKTAPSTGGPQRLQPFPRFLTSSSLTGRSTGSLGDLIRLPVGVDPDLEPVHLDLHPGEHAVVAGSARSGVSSTLVHLAERLRALHADADEDFIVAAIRSGRSPLTECRAVDVGGAIDAMTDYLEAALADTRRWIFLVDDAPHVEDAKGPLGRITSSNDPRLHVIGGGRSQDFHTALGHWSRRITRSRNGILLVPDLGTDGDLVGTRLPRRVPVAMVAGRGFVANAGELTLTQMAAPQALVAVDA